MSAGKQWVFIFGGLLGGAAVAGFLGALVPGLWGFGVAIVIYSLAILGMIVVLVATEGKDG